MSARGKTTKITSHNTQGFSGNALQAHMRSLATGKTDVVALQESGQIPLKNRTRIQRGLFTATVPAVTGTRRTRVSGKDVHAVFAETTGSKGKNTRCSLALYSTVKPQRVGVLNSGKKGVRPMLYAEFDDKIVANVHLPSGRPAFAAKVLKGFMAKLHRKGMIGGAESAAAVRIAARRAIAQATGNTPMARHRERQQRRKALMLVGDMNMAPKRLQQTLQPFGLTTFSPPVATQESGGTLDHAAVLGGTVTSMRTQHGSSDHSALSLSVKH